MKFSIILSSLFLCGSSIAFGSHLNPEKFSELEKSNINISANYDKSHLHCRTLGCDLFDFGFNYTEFKTKKLEETIKEALQAKNLEENHQWLYQTVAAQPKYQIPNVDWYNPAVPVQNNLTLDVFHYVLPFISNEKDYDSLANTCTQFLAEMYSDGMED